jgi:hypothetical protein
MSLIPVFFFWFIGAVMHHTEGHYDILAGKFTIFFLLTLVVMVWRPTALQFASPFALKTREKLWNCSILVCAALGCYTLARKPLMIYAIDQLPQMEPFRNMMWAACALMAVLPVLALIGFEKKSVRMSFYVLACSAIALLFAGQCLVPILSPKPWIDVWVNNTAAVDHFLNGVNPYTQDYPDIYHGAYDYKPGFLYFPGILYWFAPFRWLFGDIRYGFVFANLLIAGGCFRLARELKVPAVTAVAVVLAWLSFPVTFFVLEQAWIDTILGALAVLMFLGIVKKRWILTGICMGAAVAVKQYGFVIAFVGLVLILRQAGWKPVFKAAIAAAVACFAMLLPFMIADFGRFYASTITSQTSSSPRMDAFNATIYLIREYGIMIPGMARMVIAVIGVLGGGWLVFRRVKPDAADAAGGIFIAFGVPFVFGKWAFCNYYYLLASILLIYLAAKSRDEVFSASS